MQLSGRQFRSAALRAARRGVFLLAAALSLSLTPGAAQRSADPPRAKKAAEPAMKNAASSAKKPVPKNAAAKKKPPVSKKQAAASRIRTGLAAKKSAPKSTVEKKKPAVSKKPAAASRTRSARASKKPAKKSAVQASRLLPPAVVDSFRTIILTSCREAPEPWEVTMREEMTRWLSVRYRRAGISMNGVDCSGFISTIFRSTMSMDLPHSAAQQASMGVPVDTGSLRFGDLIFFRAKKRINHVGIYIGDGFFVHSSRTFGVRVDPLFKSRYYARRFASARRMLSVADSGEPARE